MTTPIDPKLEFSRVRVLTLDFDRSWKFYRDVLGLTPVPGHGAPPYGEFASGSGAMMSIFDRTLMAESVGLEPGRPDPRATGGSLINFETTDVDAFARRLEQMGVPLVAPPTDRPVWQLRTVHFRDPDGNLIEVFSGLPSGTAAPR